MNDILSNDVVIGRKREKAELEDAYSSKEAEFIAIYGRRRVGKTFLINRFFQSKKCLYFQTTGINGASTEVQLERFALEIGRTFYQGAPLKPPADWMTALDLLTQAIARQSKSKKIVLFIDELPWLATHKSGVLQAIEYFWNRHWVNDPRITLIVCGSSASWIMKKIIRNRGGLHNRITRRIRLKPFDLSETHAYLKHCGINIDRQHTLKLYMVLGGIPFYLKRVKKRYSVDQNIDKLLFDPDGFLFDEFTEIFASLFDYAEKYEELVRIIAGKREGILRREVELKNTLTGKGGTLSSRLEDLEIAGFITGHTLFGRKQRGILYRISDEFCYFYLSWIEPVKTQLQSRQEPNYWQTCVNTPQYYDWQGYAFENVCYKHLAQIQKKLEIPGFASVAPWRYIPAKQADEDGAQIDLLFERSDNAITLCEIKYTNKPFLIDKQYGRKLLNKKQTFIQKTKTKKQIFFAMLSAQGIKDSPWSDELVDGVVILDDLFP